jgi:hypothetical protein
LLLYDRIPRTLLVRKDTDRLPNEIKVRLLADGEYVVGVFKVLGFSRKKIYSGDYCLSY